MHVGAEPECAPGPAAVDAGAPEVHIVRGPVEVTAALGPAAAHGKVRAEPQCAVERAVSAHGDAAEGTGRIRIQAARVEPVMIYALVKRQDPQGPGSAAVGRERGHGGDIPAR